MTAKLSAALNELNPQALKIALAEGLDPQQPLTYSGGGGDEGWSATGSALDVVMNAASKKFRQLNSEHASSYTKQEDIARKTKEMFDMLSPYELSAKPGNAKRMIYCLVYARHDAGTIYSDAIKNLITWADEHGVDWDKKPGFMLGKETFRDKINEYLPGLLEQAGISPPEVKVETSFFRRRRSP